MAKSYGTLKEVLVEFTKCHLVIHAFVPWTTNLELDGLIIKGRVLFLHTMSLLGFSS